MEETRNKKNYVAEGFSFYSAQDAEVATLEKKKIEYLEAHMDYQNPEAILKIYDKAIKDRVFKTPVGLHYLKEIQQFLYKQEGVDKEQIVSIPIFHTYSSEMRQNINVVKNRVKPIEDRNEENFKYRILIMINVVLLIAIVAMFYIALYAKQPNILNYERNLTNRYASWEEELTEREQVVREKELELHIKQDINE